MEQKTCPTCGAHIDADHPEGLCPACLLSKGLEPEKSTRGADLQCAACQSSLVEGAPFCAYCGASATASSRTAERDPVRTALEAKLKGQYRLVRLLGQGGMGAVYLARDLTLDREVAIKVINTATNARDIYDRFRREAKTSAKLSHPNIVPLHAFGEVEGMPYFVMGYVRGESLAARLHRDGKLPEEEGRRILAEIADALDHAHRQGIIHRDIKPDNVLLEDESGRALLTDFGVAKALGRGETVTAAGSVVGTPQYMSPEQATGRADLDGRSDIYSLGVMAYGMLAGRLPFEGSSAADVLRKHLTQQPPPLRSMDATLSDSTVQAVDRCLAKDPVARWPDARSLKLALGAIEETQLPDSLQAVHAWGIPGAAIVMLFLTIPMLIVGGRPDWGDVVGVSSGLVVLSFFYLLLIMSLRREGFSIRQSQGAIWREPAWWLLWYPPALRRPGNVWDRLPATVRHLRWWMFSLGIYSVYLMVCLYHAGTLERLHKHSLFDDPRLFALNMAPIAAMVILWVFLMARAKRELKRKGLGLADSQRVMITVPPSRMSFWARPHIAAVLAPVPLPEPGQRSDTLHDQLQSILRCANEMSGPFKPLGAQAAIAARQLLTSIDHADQEIAEVVRNLEPGEEERLADKIAALAPAPGSSDEYAPMRLLLEKQLELIRGLSGRIEEVKARRNRRIEMLKALALHLASLRARSVEATTTEVLSLSDRVRALCDDIERQALTQATTAAGGGIK